MSYAMFKCGVQVAILALFMCGSFAVPAAAQSSQAPPQLTSATPTLANRNVVRLDLLAPLVSSIDHSLDGGRGGVFPVLVCYERDLGSRWSMGVEVLVRGGTPASRRSGAALLGRWYVVPARWSEKPLQGLYVSSVLRYQSLSTTVGDFDRPVNSGKRGGAGLLLGWQVPPFPSILPNLIIDASVGVMAWARLGDDRTSDPAYYTYINEPIFKRTGFLPDARYGLGYRF